MGSRPGSAERLDPEPITGCGFSEGEAGIHSECPLLFKKIRGVYVNLVVSPK
jgi:hypothetical protein